MYKPTELWENVSGMRANALVRQGVRVGRRAVATPVPPSTRGGVAVAWTTQPQHHAVELMVQSRWGLRFTSSADKHWLAFRSVEIAEVVLMKGRWETNNIDPVTYTLKRQ